MVLGKPEPQVVRDRWSERKTVLLTHTNWLTGLEAENIFQYPPFGGKELPVGGRGYRREKEDEREKHSTC